MDETTHFDELEQLAMSLGATNVAIRSAAEIQVEEELVSFCKNPRCPNYGLSPSCPPHVSGPDGFRKLLEDRSHVLVVRIVVPSSVLFSGERRELMAFLHELVATVELAAIENGYTKSKAFAGGSCKDLFCFADDDCNVLGGKGDCRNPDRARQSMSGFGVNVSHLIKTCGWESNIKIKDPSDDLMNWVAGIVLLG
jgi:predicted metal-binding protein